MDPKELAARKRAAAAAALKIYEDGEKAGGLTDEQRTEAQRLSEEAKRYSDQLNRALEDDSNRKVLADLMGGDAGDAGDSSDNSGKSGGEAEVKSLGRALVDSDSYKQWLKTPKRSGQVATAEIDGQGVKATFTVAAATFTNYDRQPNMVMVEQQRLTVADLLAQGTTTAPIIRYPREDTYTNAATTVAEGALKPEASFDTSEQDAPVRKIAVTAKVTDELFSDFPALASYIDARLPFMVKQREEAQVLSGDGIAPNLLGILNTSGIQTQAKGADVALDAIYKAADKVMTVGFFTPDGIVINPTNWQPIRLLRTADGIYILGSPTTRGPEVLWDMPVVRTTAITAGTALVGSFRLGAQLFFREGMSIESTNSNEDDFKKNLIALRVEERVALPVYRPLAFCTVTGLP